MLTGSFDYQQARKYWKVLKGRLIKEGNETVTNSYQLKLPAAAGKQRLTDIAKIGLLTPLKDVASFIKHTPFTTIFSGILTTKSTAKVQQIIEMCKTFGRKNAIMLA